MLNAAQRHREVLADYRRDFLQTKVRADARRPSSVARPRPTGLTPRCSSLAQRRARAQLAEPARVGPEGHQVRRAPPLPSPATARARADPQGPPPFPPISAYKTARSSTADALLNERGTIDSSHRMTDDILECVCEPAPVSPLLTRSETDPALVLARFRRQAYATRSDFASQRSTITGVQSRLSSTLSASPVLTPLGLLVPRADPSFASSPVPLAHQPSSPGSTRSSA